MSDITKKKAEALFTGAMNMFNSPSGSKPLSPSTAELKGSKPPVAPLPLMESSPEDIPKEDLLHLCMKINKRMQAMEVKGQEVNKKKTSLLRERKQLLDAIQQRVPIPVSPQDDQEVDMTLVLELMNKTDENQRLLMASLEKKLSDVEQSKMQELSASEARHRREVMDLQRALSAATASAATVGAAGASVAAAATAVVSASGGGDPQEHLPLLSPAASDSRDLMLEENERLAKEKDELQGTLYELVSKVKALEGQIEEGRAAELAFSEMRLSFEENLRLKNDDLNASRTENESLKNQTEEKLLYLQLQLNNMRAKDEQNTSEITTLKREAASSVDFIAVGDALVAQKKEMVEKLQNKLFENEEEMMSFRQKITENEKNLTASKLLKDEKESLLLALRRDLKVVLDAKEGALRRVQTLEEGQLRSENMGVKLTDLNEQITILQQAVDERNTLVTRLRAEAATAERTIASKGGMLATAETQLAATNIAFDSLRSDLTLREKALLDTTETLALLVVKLEALEGEIEEKIRSDEAQREGWAQREAEMLRSHEEAIAEVRSKGEERFETIKKENLKKSSLARTLLTEREEENSFLRAKNEELVTEIKSGAPSDRRIFELAEVQAKREAVHGLHGNNREIAFQQLQTTLAKKDFELAKLQQNQSNLVAEISELRRHTKREGVNLDYLKNIVLQYMTFPLQSPEKASLVPVIAMLLQFNAKEMGQVLKDPLWGNRPVKEVKRALNRAVVRLPPPVEIEVPVERKADREPLLSREAKHPSDTLEYEDDDEIGSSTSAKC